MDDRVAHLPLEPSRAGQQARKPVHRTPTVDALPEFLQFRFSDACKSGLVARENLAGQPARAVLLKQSPRHVEYVLGARLFKLSSVLE